MTDEVGKEIGNKLGHFIEVDKRSWQEDQAKFMRVRVDIPIEKPLRRGGHVANTERERVWVTFKYERLPTFCFNCGVMRHDNKHCHMKRDRQNGNPPYGDWMRARGASKGGLDRKEPPISRSEGASEEENCRGLVRAVVERGRADAYTRSEHFETPIESQSFEVKEMEMLDNPSMENQVGWDRREKDV